MRRFAVALIVANLLLCPLRCLGVVGCCGSSDSAPEIATCDCGHCPHSRDTAPDGSNVPRRDNGCDSCQCVCGGALADKSSPCSAGLTAGGFVAMAHSPATCTLFCQRTLTAAKAHPPDKCSGRDLRLLVVSLVC